MKVAILGGSFNPPHICHVFVTHYVLAMSEVDQLWFVPCYKHAFGKPLAAFHHRLAMCSLAVLPFREDLVRVLPIERERQGTSWTIDTIRYLKRISPEIDFTWIIGSDVLAELDKWKNFDELQHLISFFVAPRAGSWEQPQRHADSGVMLTPESIRCLRDQSYALELQGVQLPNISSSLVRERMKRRQSIRHLVPRKVEEYIYAHRLYQEYVHNYYK